MALTPSQRNAKLKKILDRTTDLEFQEVPKTMFAMGYGDKGTGKTVAFMALAQKIRGNGSILYLDSSEGWVSLDNPKFRSLKKGVSRFPIDEPSDLMLIASAIATHAKGFEKVSVVVLDEGSSIFTRMLHAWVREQNGLGADEELPEIEGKDYSAPGAAFLSMVNAFIASGVHFLMVAHEQGRNVQGDANQKKMTPSFGPKLTNDLGQLMHVVGRFESRQVQGEYRREVQSWPTKFVDAKSRLSDLDTKMDTIAWVGALAKWTNSSRIQEDLTKPAPQRVGVEDTAVDDEVLPSTEDDDFEVIDDDETGEHDQ